MVRTQNTDVAGSRDPSTHTRAVAFRWGLLAITVGALSVRLLFAFTVANDLPLKGDAVAFRELGAHLADGDGYVSTALGTSDLRPSATHPPAFPLELAALDLVGLRSLGAQRAALAFVGALGVALLGVVGRRLGGPAVGLVAPGLAPPHPLWVAPGGVIMSESLYLVVVTAILLAALMVLERPTPLRALGLGVAMGAAVLTRSESVLLVVLLGLPVVLVASSRAGVRLRIGGAILAGTLVLVGPWVVRNQVQVDAATLSTNGGGTLTGSYCDATFRHGDSYGGWSLLCAFGAAAAVRYDTHGDIASEPDVDGRLRAIARRYATDHLAELPGVGAARAGRLWGVYHSGDELRFDVVEGRPRSWQQVGQYVHWVLLALAAVGAAVLTRSDWKRWWVVVMPMASATMAAVAIYGSTRMRVMAEPSIALLAAAGIMGIVSIVARWRGSARPGREHATSGAPGGGPGSSA